MKNIIFACVIWQGSIWAQSSPDQWAHGLVPDAIEVLNAASTGTALHKLAKLTGAPSTAVVVGAGDTTGAIGIVIDGAGTSGPAVIVDHGQTACVFDGATVAGDYVQISPSVAGDCHDAGGAFPSTGQVLGIVTSTNGSGGTYTVLLVLRQPSTSTGGGGSTPTDSTTAGNGYLFINECAYCLDAGSLNGGVANGAAFYQKTIPYTFTSRFVAFGLAAGSGTGCTGGTCGVLIEITNAARTTVECLSEAGTSGNATTRKNINQTGGVNVKVALAWSSGAAVSGGVCTLPPAVYWLITTTDSTALHVYGDAVIQRGQMVNADGTVRWGYLSGGVSTGNGASIAFSTITGSISDAAAVNAQMQSFTLIN